jgi:MFS family permease
LITTGALGDRIGRKRFMMSGLTLFGLGSWERVVNHHSVQIGFRALWPGGRGHDSIHPSHTIDVFRDHTERARAISI